MMLTYHSGRPDIFMGKKVDDHSYLYEIDSPLGIDEFSLTRTELNKFQNYILKHVNTQSLLLLYEGSVILTSILNEKLSDTLSLTKGAILYIPAKIDLNIQGGEDRSILFRCCSPF